MLEQKLIRCEPDDPNRCQAVHPGQQCPFLRQEGSKYCPRHSATASFHEKQQTLRKYRLKTFHDRFVDFTTAPRVKELYEEIAILRMTLESVINGCTTEEQLIGKAFQIQQLVTGISSTLEKCVGIETKVGNVLSRDQASSFVDALTEILTTEIDNPDKLQVIGAKLSLKLEEIFK